jgi:hypothetical protein
MEDNGANPALNCRIKVDKTLNKYKNTYVIKDLVVYSNLSRFRKSKKETLFLNVMRSLLPRHSKNLLAFSRKSRRGFGRAQ